MNTSDPIKVTGTFTVSMKPDGTSEVIATYVNPPELKNHQDLALDLNSLSQQIQHFISACLASYLHPELEDGYPAGVVLSNALQRRFGRILQADAVVVVKFCEAWLHSKGLTDIVCAQPEMQAKPGVAGAPPLVAVLLSMPLLGKSVNELRALSQGILRPAPKNRLFGNGPAPDRSN